VPFRAGGGIEKSPERTAFYEVKLKDTTGRDRAVTLVFSLSDAWVRADNQGPVMWCGEPDVTEPAARWGIHDRFPDTGGDRPGFVPLALGGDHWRPLWGRDRYRYVLPGRVPLRI